VIANQSKKSVSEYSLMLHQRGWVANHDGNVSQRSGDRFYITPTSTSKRLCDAEAIVECDLAGKPIGRGKPPSEVALHAGAYRARPDAMAVIHAHPPHASAFALVGRELGPIAMPEVVVSLGERIPLVSLLLPKDPEAGRAVGAALESADVALLAGNGAIAIGDDLEQAYLRLELVEHYARIMIAAEGAVGRVSALDPRAIERLLEMRKQSGLAGPSSGRADPQDRDPNPPLHPSHRAGEPSRVVATSVRQVVAEEVQRALGVQRK
jgi:L-fuculose-phosphate aldolase